MALFFEPRSRLFHALLGASFALSIALPSGSAFAQVTPDSETRAAAVSLFDDARNLMAAGNYAEACPKLEQSQKMDPGIGTLFNLADCNEHIGRTASAWIGFRDVAAEARARKQPERERIARERAAAIEPRLTKLRVDVSAEARAAAIQVTRDGAAVPEALWGTAVPLDPGTHVIRAVAKGFAPWETSIEVAGEGRVVAVTVPALSRETQAAAPPPPLAPVVSPAPPASAPASPPPDEPPSPDGAWRAPVGLVVAGVGLVGMGVGTAFGFMAKSTFDDSAPYCDDDGRCDQPGLDLRDDAVGKGNLGTVFFIAGSVLAAGGAILWLTAPSASDSASGQTVRVGVGAGDVVVSGTF